MSADSADAELVEDLRWFPIELDKRTGAIVFADITGRRPEWQPYLDRAAGGKAPPASGEEPAQRNLSAAAAHKLTADGTAPPRVNFIWHTAYCCSTAIARALDVPPRNLSIHEPQLLNSVAAARREADRSRRDISWLADAAFRLLGRPYADGAAVTIRPSPAANYLVPDAAAKTSGKMLFLYSDCRSFLIASRRYGENRARFVRQLFNIIRQEGDAARRWTAESVAGLTDLEVAGLVWQLQIAKFSEHMKRYGDRAASLDCDAFLARPKDMLAAIWRFLELPGDVAESDAFKDPDFFSSHVKYPEEGFTLRARQEADDALHPRISEQVDRMAEASMALLPKGALPLPNPLAAANEVDA